MDFKQLEAFVAVVEYNSFSEAARHLYLTQPTISAHIQSLEEELNARLILRTTKKLAITQQGYQLYDSAIRMLNMRSNVVEEFTGRRKKIIDLGVSTIPSAYILPDVLSAFAAQMPEVCFHAWQSDSRGAVEKVLNGSVDLSMVGDIAQEESCHFIPFCQDNLVIAAPANAHFLKYQETGATLLDFLREPFIMREDGSGTKKEMEQFLERQGISQDSLNIVACMNDLEAIRKSIAKGLGISILSARSTQDLAASRKILLFPLSNSAPTRTFYIVYSKNRILKPHVKQFIQFVRDFYGDSLAGL